MGKKKSSDKPDMYGSAIFLSLLRIIHALCSWVSEWAMSEWGISERASEWGGRREVVSACLGGRGDEKRE